MPVPVVTGVGHETDETIVDFVADLRAPTPSAAAERATPDIREVAQAVRILDRTMATAAGQRLSGAAAAVETRAVGLRQNAPATAEMGVRATRLLAAMGATLDRQVTSARHRTDRASAQLGALDPRATLHRGFAIVQGAQSRKVVSSIRRVKPGDRLSVAVSDGAFWSEVS
jgi:exodeoxyribonuclease VII large subunit